MWRSPGHFLLTARYMDELTKMLTCIQQNFISLRTACPHEPTRGDPDDLNDVAKKSIYHEQFLIMIQWGILWTYETLEKNHQNTIVI